MKKHFIRQIVFVISLALIASSFNAVQADYLPTENNEYYTVPELPNYVLRKRNDNNKNYGDGIPWLNEEGFWIGVNNNVETPVDNIKSVIDTDNSGNVISLSANPSNPTWEHKVEVFSDKVFYLQDKVTKTINGASVANLGVALETRASLFPNFAGKALYIGLNTYINESGNQVSEFSTNQMRLGLGLYAYDTAHPEYEYQYESDLKYHSDYAVDVSNVYLGHGIINSRLNEGTYRYNENTGEVSDEESHGEVTINTFSVVGMKGTLHVLPDSNPDDTFRSVIGNNNKNRHIVIDPSCKVVIPEGAKLEFLSASWDNHAEHHPYSILPIYGNIEGDGKVQYRAMREDAILVYGTNDNFSGQVVIDTEDFADSATPGRFDHSYIVSGIPMQDNPSEGIITGIKGSSVHIITGNLIIQTDHTLNNLSSDRSKTATTRIAGTDALFYSNFLMDGYKPTESYVLSPQTLTLNNTEPTTYYGSISKVHDTTKEAIEIHGGENVTVKYNNYDFTGGSLYKLVKDGDETLNLYCAGSDGGIRAESFVVSSGRINFNGYFKGVLTVEAGTVFSPDTWGWGGDSAISTAEDAVQIDGNIQVQPGGKIEFNFSKYNEEEDNRNNDVITMLGNGKFETPDYPIISLAFMEKDPAVWATENAKYLLVNGGGFEDGDYSHLLLNRYGNNALQRQFALMAEGGKLYLVTTYYIPEPSTWALLVLGAAGLLFWRKKK